MSITAGDSRDAKYFKRYVRWFNGELVFSSAWYKASSKRTKLAYERASLPGVSSMMLAKQLFMKECQELNEANNLLKSAASKHAYVWRLYNLVPTTR